MARGRPSRAAARRTSLERTATPHNDSDEEMADAPGSPAVSTAPADDADTPAHVSDEDDEEEKAPFEPESSPVVQPFPRKKRLGRPPKNRPPDWNVIPDDGETPVKRKRGRPVGSGRPGRPKAGEPRNPSRVAIDKEGTMADIVGDEVDLPEDPEGEEKVDKLGNLKGGRDYRVRVFTIGGRGDRLYMLSTEPARCCGFRDSYLFFTKHMQLHKIIVSDAEKRDLIERDIIPHSYKGRSIGVVTARSVFREFGAKIIIGGKKIIDDYHVAAARERGDVEGELAAPEDKLPPPGEPYNKNQYVAWHGASSVYHTGQPSVPLAQGKPLPGKRKVNITSANWQFEHARSASRFNTSLSAIRKANLTGVYDPHTNLMCYPLTTQPTHARWEQVPASESDVPPLIRKNYLIVDTYMQSPPFSGLGVPGPDGDFLDVGTNGLPDLEDEDIERMGEGGREAFLRAKEREREWKGAWRGEAEDGCRKKLRITLTGVPV